MVKYLPLFDSFFQGGFECSTHRLRSGKRLDEIAATRHDTFARQDYERLLQQGMRTAREGVSWHLVEARQGNYDFASALSLIRAADEFGVQVIWDLCHYGWPDWLDIFEPHFVDAFAGLAREFARLLTNESERFPIICPINEISFFSWAAGELAHMNPYAMGRGDELKEQLVRTSIAATEAIWDINPKARMAQIDPVINVLPDHPANEAQVRAAAADPLSQSAARDMR